MFSLAVIINLLNGNPVLINFASAVNQRRYSGAESKTSPSL